MTAPAYATQRYDQTGAILDAIRAETWPRDRRLWGLRSYCTIDSLLSHQVRSNDQRRILNRDGLLFVLRQLQRAGLVEQTAGETLWRTVR